MIERALEISELTRGLSEEEYLIQAKIHYRKHVHFDWMRYSDCVDTFYRLPAILYWLWKLGKDYNLFHGSLEHFEALFLHPWKFERRIPFCRCRCTCWGCEASPSNYRVLRKFTQHGVKKKREQKKRWKRQDNARAHWHHRGPKNHYKSLANKQHRRWTKDILIKDWRWDELHRRDEKEFRDEHIWW